jgi:integrase
MAKGIHRLTDTFCKRKALKRGAYSDGGGLYLQISKSGTRAWVLRYMVNGRARTMGLGAVGIITLADAREKARAAQSLRVDGVDPIDERSARKAKVISESAGAMTFKQCAESYIEANKAGWKSDVHAKQWPSTLKTYVYPVIGSLPVGAVDDVHIMKILQPIWNTKAETASRVRGRIEKVLDRAKALKLRSGENPARWTGHLDQLLPRKVQIAPVEHHAALPYKALPAFMGELRKRSEISAKALEFTILTAARTAEVTGARWSEIDLEAKVWTVPASRIKGKRGATRRDHTVPLSNRALAILRGLPRINDFVFPGDGKAGGLSTKAMPREAPESVTVHGFRSTFKDWCTEQTAYPNEMSELALAHTVSDKVEAAYRRGDMLEKRRRLMADWSLYCEGKAVGGDNVVAISRR